MQKTLFYILTPVIILLAVGGVLVLVLKPSFGPEVSDASVSESADVAAERSVPEPDETYTDDALPEPVAVSEAVPEPVPALPEDSAPRQVEVYEVSPEVPASAPRQVEVYEVPEEFPVVLEPEVPVAVEDPAVTEQMAREYAVQVLQESIQREKEIRGQRREWSRAFDDLQGRIADLEREIGMTQAAQRRDGGEETVEEPSGVQELILEPVQRDGAVPFRVRAEERSPFGVYTGTLEFVPEAVMPY